MPVVRVIALNEVLQIHKGHGMLLEGEVHIGPQVVDPDLFGLPLRAGRALVKKDHVGLDAGLVEDTGRQTEDGMEVAGFQ